MARKKKPPHPFEPEIICWISEGASVFSERSQTDDSCFNEGELRAIYRLVRVERCVTKVAFEEVT